MASKIPLPENLKHCLIQYIKNKQNQRIGVMVAIPDPESHWYSVGWSKCNHWADSFNKEKALDIAFGRAQAHSDMSAMPKSLWGSDLYHKFIDRCDAYFKVDLVENEDWIHKNPEVLGSIQTSICWSGGSAGLH